MLYPGKNDPIQLKFSLFFQIMCHLKVLFNHRHELSMASNNKMHRCLKQNNGVFSDEYINLTDKVGEL